MPGRPIPFPWGGTSEYTQCMTESAVATVRLREDGILEYRYQRGAVVTREGARLAVETVRSVADSLPRPTLVLMGHVKSVDKGARDYFASEENATVSSQTALVTASRVSKVIANFFLGINNPQHAAVRVFASVDEALVWLRAN